MSRSPESLLTRQRKHRKPGGFFPGTRIPGSPRGNPEGTKILRIASIALILAAGPAAAQESQDTIDLTQASMRSPVLALVLEAPPVPPLLGHWYAGDVERGLLPLAVSLGGLGLGIMCHDFLGSSAGCSDAQETIVTLGLLTFVGGWIWRMASAYRTASDRNQAIRRARDGAVAMSCGIDCGSG